VNVVHGVIVVNVVHVATGSIVMNVGHIALCLLCML